MAFAAPLSTAAGTPMAHGSRRGEKNWNTHVDNMEQLADTAAFRDLRDRILGMSGLWKEATVLDVGAGTGLLALAAAPQVARVYAVDSSREMCRRLADKAASGGLGNVEVAVASATALPHAPGSVDIVVSNYCFHHLTNSEKALALAEIRRVLRPGGRVVFADMMFRISLMSRRDRGVILRVTRRMVAHGPAGVVRVLRHALRLATGHSEHPVSIDWWRDALLAAGFVAVTVEALDHEGGIASARQPV